MEGEDSSNTEIITCNIKLSVYNEHLLYKTAVSFVHLFTLLWTGHGVLITNSFILTRSPLLDWLQCSWFVTTEVSVSRSRPFHRRQCPYWTRPPLISPLQCAESTRLMAIQQSFEVTKRKRKITGLIWATFLEENKTCHIVLLLMLAFKCGYKMEELFLKNKQHFLLSEDSKKQLKYRMYPHY